MKTFLAGGALTLATAGLVGTPAVAHADDDFKKRSGSCSGASKYTMTLREAGDDPDRLRSTFVVNSNKKNRLWRVTIKRSGKVVHRAAKRTGPRGNVKFAKRFRGDDDAFVRVIARAGYGERCNRGMRLDD